MYMKFLLKKLIRYRGKVFKHTVLMTDNTVGTVIANCVVPGDIVVLEVHDGAGDNIIRLGEVREVMRREKA